MAESGYFCSYYYSSGAQLNRSLSILRNIALSLVGLIVLVAILVNLTPVQNFIARRVLVSLAEKLETKVSV